MRLYLSLFKIKFINNLQYRAAAVAGLSTQFFFGLVYIFVYLEFYGSNAAVIPPMKLGELVSYLWLNQALFSLTYIWNKEKNLLSMIKDGNIAYELCRPIKFYNKWYFTMYGSRIASVLLRCFPVIIVAFLLPSPYNLILPPSFLSFLLFIISVFISSLLVTSIGMIFHLITFFTIDEKGVLTLLMVIGEIFSGGVVPLPFFPKFLQVIANLLPFRHICDLPFRIYSGNVLPTEAIINMLFGIVWLVICILIGKLLTGKVLKKTVVHGG